MTLDYEILWIDDREDFFKIHESSIYDYIEEKGFSANITKHMSFEEFKAKENTPEVQKKYDLFIIDLNLDHGKTGNEIIADIRDNRILTDVIFYSTMLADVRQKIREDNIEGVYSTSRNKEDFEEKVCDVIDVTIKKVQDVNNLRGLIMAEVAELDRLKASIIKKYCEQTEHKDNELKKYVKDRVFSAYKSNLQKFDFLVSKEPDSHERMNLETFVDELIFDSYKKARTTHKINEKSDTGIEFNFEQYYNDVIKKRNVFAHVKESFRESDNIKVLHYPDGSELEFTEEHCVQIRNDIRRYRAILEEIDSSLKV